jgi:hypothetical protein
VYRAKCAPPSTHITGSAEIKAVPDQIDMHPGVKSHTQAWAIKHPGVQECCFPID